MTKLCKIDGCNNSARINSMCNTHYSRVFRGADPNITPIREKSVFDRLIERAIIQENGCWIYTGTILNNGYGQISIKSRGYSVHRVAYDLVVGDIPNGMEVCHSCDNPACVNLEHLFLGTHEDNEIDKTNKGRRPLGENCGSSILSVNEVKQIRYMLNQGISQHHIAKLFKVSRSAIKHIKLKESWAWLE